MARGRLRADESVQPQMTAEERETLLPLLKPVVECEFSWTVAMTAPRLN